MYEQLPKFPLNQTKTHNNPETKNSVWKQAKPGESRESSFKTKQKKVLTVLNLYFPNSTLPCKARTPDVTKAQTVNTDYGETI